ncbi:MAG: M23/M56 family metallopeptidase [Bacteroidota bacterium]
MFSYILQVTLCWSAFYLLYLGLLRKETFFHVNRWYLLGTLAIGLLIPLVEWQPSPVIENHRTYEIAIEPIQFQMGQLEQSIEAASQSALLNWTDICLAIYLSGVLFFIALLLHGLWKIWKLYRAGKVERQGNILIVYTSESHLPFSFFNCLFWSKHFEAAHKEKAQILRHEEAHIYQWHTLDVLFLEVLNILFWCSPIIYFYRKSLRTTHEYLADALVLQETKRKEYGHLLLKQSLSGIQIALANHFIQSQLKNRILMMTRNKSRKRNLMKYLPFLPILLLAILVFSKHDGRVQMEKAVASLMSVEKRAFDEKEITERLRELASDYVTFTQEDMKDNGRFLDFASDYKDLMETYDKSEREIADLTQAIFLQYDIVVEPSVDALTRITRISFLNSNGANGKFTLFFDDDFGLMNNEIVSIEKQLHKLAETHQRFGCCDANPEAPHEQFSADYINFLSSFGDPKQKLQVAHLTEEIFKDYKIEVDLMLVDVDRNKNYVLNEISFKTDDRVNGGSARKFTYYVNDDDHHVDQWKVTLTQFLKLTLKSYEEATSESERNEALAKFKKEQERWIQLYPEQQAEIEEIVDELWNSYNIGGVLEGENGKVFDQLFFQLAKSNNGLEQLDAFKDFTDFLDNMYDIYPREPIMLVNEIYRRSYRLSDVHEVPLEYRLDGKGNIKVYLMAGDAHLDLYKEENQYLNVYESDFLAIRNLDASSVDDQLKTSVVTVNQSNTNKRNFQSSYVKRTIPFNALPEEFKTFQEGKDNRFQSLENKIQILFASRYTVNHEEERPSSDPRAQMADIRAQRELSDFLTFLIHPIKDPNKITREMGYGMRKHPIFKKRQLHTGVDYVVPMNTEIVATADGKVAAVKNWQKGYGLHISVEHKNGYATFYAHLEKSLVKVGQSVKQGEVIALSGNTGTSTGPHLHYEVRKDGKAIDFEDASNLPNHQQTDLEKGYIDFYIDGKRQRSYLYSE